jgi:hypothetical protein
MYPIGIIHERGHNMEISMEDGRVMLTIGWMKFPLVKPLPEWKPGENAVDRDALNLWEGRRVEEVYSR